MKTIKPLLINNLDFALSEQTTSGSVDLPALQRLIDLLALPIGELDQYYQMASIQYKLAGFARKHNHASLHLAVDAELPTFCQRCLGEMTLQLRLDFDYIISDIEPSEFDADDDIDWLEASREMNVWELIEDELLIAFPIAPVHSAAQQEKCVSYNMQSGEKPNPFAVLKNLPKKSS